MKVFLCVLLLAISQFSLGQDTIPGTPSGPQLIPPSVSKENDSDKKLDLTNSLSPLITYNFSGGKNGLTSLTPVINYGWTKPVGKFLKGTLAMSLNPYVAGQINIKDQNSFIPALMLPGIAGLNANLSIKYSVNSDIDFYWLPANFGLKLNSQFLDSSKVIMQHNLRTGIGFSYAKFFQLGIQYSHGWHNGTSESENNFKEIFAKGATDIDYMTIVLQVSLNGKRDSPNVLFTEWRGLLSQNQFKGFTNSKILSIGFRKEFNLDNIPAILAPAAPGN